MSVAELLPMIKVLPIFEKFRLLQFLIVELGKEAGFLLLDPSVTYPTQTPYAIPAETVVKLEKMLAEDRLTYEN